MTGDPLMMETTCRSVKPTGTVVIVGNGMKDFRASAKRLMWYEPQILGFRAFSRDNVHRVMRMVLDQ